MILECIVITIILVSRIEAPVASYISNRCKDIFHVIYEDSIFYAMISSSSRGRPILVQ